jgi:mRNA interferase MazF
MLSFDPEAGHEQTGNRPALVLSPNTYNAKVGLALLCPITNRLKGYPFEVSIPTGLKITGVILSDQVESSDWRMRNARYADKVSRQVVNEVVAKLQTLLA